MRTVDKRPWHVKLLSIFRYFFSALLLICSFAGNLSHRLHVDLHAQAPGCSFSRRDQIKRTFINITNLLQCINRTGLFSQTSFYLCLYCATFSNCKFIWNYRIFPDWSLWLQTTYCLYKWFLIVQHIPNCQRHQQPFFCVYIFVKSSIEIPQCLLLLSSWHFPSSALFIIV